MFHFVPDDEERVLYNAMKYKRPGGKWNEPKLTLLKSWSLSEEGDSVYIGGLESLGGPSPLSSFYKTKWLIQTSTVAI